MKFHLIVIAAFGIIRAEPAQANDSGKSLHEGLAADTFGIGSEIAYRITPRIGVRAETTILTIHHGINYSTLNSGGTVKLQSGSALADVFPFKSGFHISGGVRFYASKVSAVARPMARTEYTINGKRYSASTIELLAANTNLTSVAPVVTVGYTARFSKDAVLGIEAGTLLRGGINASPLMSNGPCASAAPRGICGNSIADLEAERQGMSRDMSKAKVYPLAQLKFGYRF